MGLKVDVSQLCDIANGCGMQNADELIGDVVAAVERLADAVSDRLGVQHIDTSDEGVAFGGLLSNFGPAAPRDACPTAIRDADPSGDWE